MNITLNVLKGNQIFSFHEDIILIIHSDKNNFNKLQKKIYDYKYKKYSSHKSQSFPFVDFYGVISFRVWF